MIYQVLVSLLPLWANGDTTGLTYEEAEAATKFEADYGLNTDLWRVLTRPSGEWVVNFDKCEVLGVYGSVVYLYQDDEDLYFLRLQLDMDEESNEKSR